MRTERYELRDEPCAAGAWRGGIGMVRTNRFLVDTLVSCEGDRHESDLPWGIFGGHDGLNASLTRNVGQPDEESWPAKITGFRLNAGDTLQIKVPNSGGYGDPLDARSGAGAVRRPRRVHDRRAGAPDYGVVIDEQRMAVDVEATQRLREELAQRTVAR